MPPSEVLRKERICEWCAQSIPQQAIKCPFCHKWRNDIDKARQKAIAGFVGGIGLALLALVLLRGIIQSGAGENLLSTSGGWVVIVLLICSVGLTVMSGHYQQILKRKTGSTWPYLH
jgi:hypothetical protein